MEREKDRISCPAFMFLICAETPGSDTRTSMIVKDLQQQKSGLQQGSPAKQRTFLKTGLCLETVPKLPELLRTTWMGSPPVRVVRFSSVVSCAPPPLLLRSQQQSPDRSGQSRTSTARGRLEWALPDLNTQHTTNNIQPPTHNHKHIHKYTTTNTQQTM